MDSEFENQTPAPDSKPELRWIREIPFADGQEVIMKRPGKDGGADWFQAGWKVQGFDETTGKYTVTFDDKETGKVLEKPVSPAELTSYQPDAMVDTPEATELSDVGAEFAPKPAFSVGDIVTVRRKLRDADGKRIPGEGTFEGGWEVVEIDAEAGVVMTRSPDKKSFKLYPIEVLKEIRAEVAAPAPQAIIDKVPDFGVEAAQSIIDIEGSGELREDASEDLGEKATKLVVEEPKPDAESSLTIPERLAELVKDFSDDDRSTLRNYAEASQTVAEMQRDGRGEDSIYWQRFKGQYYLSLSPAAREVAKQYAALFNMQKE